MEAVVVVGDMAGVEEAAGTAVAAMAVGMTMPGTIERLVLPWE